MYANVCKISAKILKICVNICVIYAKIFVNSKRLADLSRYLLRKIFYKICSRPCDKNCPGVFFENIAFSVMAHFSKKTAQLSKNRILNKKHVFHQKNKENKIKIKSRGAKLLTKYSQKCFFDSK